MAQKEKAPGWYSTGYEGVDREKVRKETEQRPNRLWLKPGSMNRLVFLDDEPFCIYEYNWFANDSWMNWATVPEDSDANDVFREKGLRPSFTGIFSAINCSPWKDGQGKEHNFGLTFIAAKEKTVELIKDRRASKGSLVGKMFKVKRFEGDKTLSAGDDYDYERDVDLDEALQLAMFRGKKFVDLINQANEDPTRMAYLKSKFQLVMDEGKALPKLVPFNYMDLLKPPTLREARNLMGGVTKRAGKDSTGTTGGTTEDEIPF